MYNTQEVQEVNRHNVVFTKKKNFFGNLVKIVETKWNRMRIMRIEAKVGGLLPDRGQVLPPDIRQKTKGGCPMRISEILQLCQIAIGIYGLYIQAKKK